MENDDFDILQMKKDILVAGALLRKHVNTTELISSQTVSFMVNSSYQAIVALEKKPKKPKSLLKKRENKYVSNILKFERKEK